MRIALQAHMVETPKNKGFECGPLSDGPMNTCRPNVPQDEARANKEQCEEGIKAMAETLKGALHLLLEGGCKVMVEGFFCPHGILLHEVSLLSLSGLPVFPCTPPSLSVHDVMIPQQ